MVGKQQSEVWMHFLIQVNGKVCPNFCISRDKFSSCVQLNVTKVTTQHPQTGRATVGRLHDSPEPFPQEFSRVRSWFSIV